MYDPIETEVSYNYLVKLKERLTNLRWTVVGGWGIFFQVKKEFNRAFGREYLKSRDIDIFIDSKHEEEFLKIIKGLGFKESSYKFRYELIYDRETNNIISHEEAKKSHIFSLIYIFLDVFSDKKTKKLGSWDFPFLKNSKIETIETFPVIDINSLLNLKLASFFEREKLDKELKDACDIFALLFYSGKKIKRELIIKNAAKKIIDRYDLQQYIAENVLGDSLKSSLVVGMLRGFQQELKKDYC